MMNYLTAVEAAKLLGISRQSVDILVKTGKLAVYRIGPDGGTIRFTEADLEQYLESCRMFGAKSQSRAASRPKASRDRAKRNGAEPSKRPDDPEAAIREMNRRLSAMPPLQKAPGNNED